MAEPWAPSLGDVGRLIPTRTRDQDPGSDKMLGTFTQTTTPTADQAQEFIDDAVNTVRAVVGALPVTPSAPQQVADLCQQAARVAAAAQAAADIEVAYPNRDGDVRVAAVLQARAAAAMGALKTAMAQTGSGDLAVYPVGNYPPPYASMGAGGAYIPLAGAALGLAGPGVPYSPVPDTDFDPYGPYAAPGDGDWEDY